ncbi:MAG: hypothetical protein RL701_3492 [Pseudomonadota bacterium]
MQTHAHELERWRGLLQVALGVCLTALSARCADATNDPRDTAQAAYAAGTAQPTAAGSTPVLASAPSADWRALPIQHDTRYVSQTSHGPETLSAPQVDIGNKDFNSFLAICGTRPTLRDQTVADVRCDDQLQGYLIASDTGRGVLSRLFFPAMSSTAEGFGSERIRVYIDDLTTPLYDASLLDWRQDRGAPPLTHWTSGALVSYAPIVYERSLRIVLDQLRPEGLHYYQADLQRGPGTTAQTLIPLDNVAEDFAALERSVHAAVTSDVRNLELTLEPGATSVVLAAAGSGTLEQLRFTLPQPARAALHDLTLRVTWDGAIEPALALPLAGLFGCFESDDCSYETLPLAVRANPDNTLELEASWPMPFAERALVELTNTGEQVHTLGVRLALDPTPPPPESGRLHVGLSQSRPPYVRDQTHPVIEVAGRGKYVGTLMHLTGQVDPQSATPYPLGFMEGDERVRVDGQLTGHGTGTEDYFDGGWYYRDGKFSSPQAALIAITSDTTLGTGMVTAARWSSLRDAIEFRESLDISFEYGANRPASAAAYTSVAFYYLSEP